MSGLGVSWYLGVTSLGSPGFFRSKFAYYKDKRDPFEALREHVIYSRACSSIVFDRLRLIHHTLNLPAMCNVERGMTH